MGSLELHGLPGDDPFESIDHLLKILEPAHFDSMHSAELLSPRIERVSTDPVLAANFLGGNPCPSLGQNSRDLPLKGGDRIASVKWSLTRSLLREAAFSRAIGDIAKYIVPAPQLMPGVVAIDWKNFKR